MISGKLAGETAIEALKKRFFKKILKIMKKIKKFFCNERFENIQRFDGYCSSRKKAFLDTISKK